MLVEDDPDIAILAEIALKEIGGLELVHFPSGEEALGGVIEADPDLIILDYRMPGMNGAQVLSHLKADQRTRDWPVLFMTASLMPKHIEGLLELGALAVLPKPFDPLTLADEVRRHWAAR
ncbi:response regulator [Sphingomonas sp. GCM10030256]|uniref:response regulator n=1 Tax=Sphingomonas sp. GCM10030256 TaxID=3273427 RepID=UPI0036202F6E